MSREGLIPAARRAHSLHACARAPVATAALRRLWTLQRHRSTPTPAPADSTSATLAVGHDFYRPRAGAGPQGSASRFESPFDYERQAPAVSPRHRPQPSESAIYTDRGDRGDAAVARGVRGGAFVLFHQSPRAAGRRREARDGAAARAAVAGAGQRRRANSCAPFPRQRPCGAARQREFLGGRRRAGPALRLVMIDRSPFA